MLRFIIIGSLIFNGTSATTSDSKKDVKNMTEKYSIIDDNKFPNVFKSYHQFKFKEVIISYLNNKNLSYLVFDLILDREITEAYDSHEEDLPLVLDSVLSDLFPTINLFNTGRHDTLQHSLQERLDRILKAKFKWITGVKVLNTRIQASGNE